MRPLSTHQIDALLRDADIVPNDLIYSYDDDPYRMNIFGCHLSIGEYDDPVDVLRCTRRELRRWLRAAFRAGRRSQ